MTLRLTNPVTVIVLTIANKLTMVYFMGVCNVAFYNTPHDARTRRTRRIPGAVVITVLLLTTLYMLVTLDTD